MSSKSIKKLASVIKPVIAIILATILFTQVYALGLPGGTGGRMLPYASAQSSPTSTTDTGGNSNDASRKGACAYRDTVKKLSEQPTLDDYETANHYFNSGVSTAETDYRLGVANRAHEFANITDGVRSNDELARIAFKNGYSCGYGPSMEKQQPTGDGAKDQACLCTGETCPNPNLVRSGFSPLSQRSIRPASYTIDVSNSYQNPDIINVQGSGEPTTPKSSKCPLPIIFIPGIGGSKLEREGSVIERDLWPLAFLGGQSYLMLDRDGRPIGGTRIVANEVLRIIGFDIQVTINDIGYKSSKIYEPLIKFLEGEGTKEIPYKENTNLFMFPYDWRLDNNIHVVELDKKVNEVLKKTNSKNVILISHSMGGLIARAYINTIGSQKVDTLISMAMPFYGSPVPFYGLTSGYTMGNPSFSQSLMKILEQNWAAGYQLAPRKPFIQDSVTGKHLTVDESYDVRYKGFIGTTPGTDDLLSSFPSSYAPTKGNIWSANRDLIDRANAFHTSLVDPNTNQAIPLPAGVRHFAIIGFGVKTLNSFGIRDATLDEINKGSFLELHGREVVLEPRLADGDGTVPLWSSEFDGVTAKYYVPYIATGASEHTALTANTHTHNIIKKIIEGNPIAGYSPPKRYNDPGVDWTIHSDAHMTVIDESTGNRLGYNNLGGIDENIPTGAFLSTDAGEYASVVDTSKTYKLVVNGTNDGNFTLSVNVTKPEGATHWSYPKVSVKKGTLAQMTMTPDKVTTSSIPILQVNNDGIITDVAATVGPARAAANTSASTPTAGGGGGTDNGFLTYDNSNYGFKIKYPQDWKAEKGKGKYPDSPYTEVVKFSPSDSEYASVLAILDPDRDTPIPDLLRDSVEEYNNHDTLKDVNVVESSSESLLAGKRAYELVFTDSTNDAEHKNKEIGSSINGKAYYISFFSEAANYEKYLPLVEQMFDSFELVGAGGGDGDGSQTSPTGTGTTSTGTTTTSPIDTSKTTTTTTGGGAGQQKQQQQGGQQIDPGVLPVLLVHGWSSNSQDWNPWENLLKQDGIPYYPITFQESDDSCGASQDHGNELEKKVEQIKQETGKDKVNIVGYSKGGLDARAYLAESGTDDVSNLIMIGTPNAGTSAATVIDFCTPGLYDLRPGASATTVDRNPNVNYYTIAGDWSPNIGGNPVIDGNDDQLVPVSSVESEQYFKNLGHTSHPHTELIGLEEYNLARPVLAGTGDGPKINASDETIIDTDPADPATSSPGQQQPLSQAILISDNFDSENKGTGELNYRSFMNWIPKEGTVDLIGNGFYDIPGGNGLYVDLDGANLDAGILESKEEFTLSPGNYVLEFDISGPYFQGDTNNVKVQLGNAFTETFTKEGDSPFEHIVRTIVISQPTAAKLSFDHSGGDNIGVKLDNVKLYKSETDGAPTTATSGGGDQQPSPRQEPPSSSQQQLSKPAKSADMVDYENPNFRLAMKSPSNWAVRENADNIVFTSPAESEADTSVESLYVYYLGDVPLGESEEETLKSNIEATINYRKPDRDFQLLSSNNIEFNGKTAGQIEYTYTDTNIGNTKAKEIIAIDGNDRYNILFIANADQYSSTLPPAQEIIDSIQITPSQEDDEPTTSDQGTNTADDGDDDSGAKIDAGGETIVDTFDDPVVTDGGGGGYTQNGVENIPISPSDFKDYSNSGFKLSMKYPSDWTVQESPNQVVFVSTIGSESDKYLESLTIAYEGNLPDEETLEKNVEAVIDHQKANLAGFQIQESQEITLLGIPAHKIVYTMDDVNIGPAKATEIILINGNNRYDLLFLANPEQYDSVLPVAEEMINSILLTPGDESSNSG